MSWFDLAKACDVPKFEVTLFQKVVRICLKRRPHFLCGLLHIV